MQQTLWGEKIPRRRRRKRIIHLPTPAFSITDNDCAYFGHTLRSWDLAGCNVCTDCGAKIYCPICCSSGHPQDASAIALLCERHEEPQESLVSA